jgi:shikimate kinase
MIISLTGFMGCGKSSVGRRLSELLCCRFIDLDQAIEEKAGKRIPEIFSSEGEAAFRALERETLAEILDSDSNESTLVLALGGGAIMQAESERMITERSRCIYLKASVDTLMSHLANEASGRPLLAGNKDLSALRARICELMELRAATYERCASTVIITDDKTIGAISQEIIDTIK